MRNTPANDLRLIAEYVAYQDAPELLGIAPDVLERYVKGISRPGAKHAAIIERQADAFRSPEFNDLLDVSQYLAFEDAADLLGVTAGRLRAVVRGKAYLEPEQSSKLHRIAKKIRRREGQVKRIGREELERAARRSVHDQLRAIGMPDVPLPDYLPPFLRSHSHGRLETPVYIYDFRKANTYEKITQFFRFMKTVLPGGAFFLTYEVLPSGTSPNGGKNFYANQNIILSTHYMEFCRTVGNDIPGGSCLMMTDNEFYDFYTDISDISAGRRVIEVGISHRRPPMTQAHYQLTPEEIAEDMAEGRDWVLGKRIIWQD